MMTSVSYRNMANSTQELRFKNPLISIIVCTFNRAQILSSCLRSLVEQTLEPSFFEVIVVDNNSTDESCVIINDFLSSKVDFRYINESNQGLSYARNRGWKEAAGEYVAFIDDDAMACSDWIKQIASFIKSHPEISVFGGPYDAFTLVQPPDWLPPEYGVFDAGDKELIINSLDIFLCGTNMIYKKSVLTEVGGFDIELGMNGKKLCYGEETNVQIKLDEMGYKIYYVPSIKVKHLINSYKTSLFWHINSIYAAGRCSSKTLSAKRSLTSHFVGICIGLASALKISLTIWGIPVKRKLYYAVKRLTAETGALHEYLSDKHT